MIIYQVSVIQKLERGRKSISICVAVGNHNVVHLSNADFVVVSLRKNLRLHSLSMFIVSRKGLFPLIKSFISSILMAFICLDKCTFTSYIRITVRKKSRCVQFRYIQNDILYTVCLLRREMKWLYEILYRAC